MLTKKSHNRAGIASIQGDSAGGSKLIKQTLYKLKHELGFSIMVCHKGTFIKMSDVKFYSMAMLVILLTFYRVQDREEYLHLSYTRC